MQHTYTKTSSATHGINTTLHAHKYSKVVHNQKQQVTPIELCYSAAAAAAEPQGTQLQYLPTSGTLLLLLLLPDNQSNRPLATTQCCSTLLLLLLLSVVCPLWLWM